MVSYTCSGRVFPESDVDTIRRVVLQNLHTSRCNISREVCKKLEWISPNGDLKAIVCRDLLLKLEKDGHIKLPEPKSFSVNRFLAKKSRVDFISPSTDMVGNLGQFPKPRIVLVDRSKCYHNSLWDELTNDHHYLGFKGVMGRSLKYLVFIDEIPVACIGWCSGSWKCAVRDKQFELGLSQGSKANAVVNNFRFTVMPWAKIKYLASHILARTVKQVQKDWEQEYCVPIKLFETFIDKDRFEGSCYLAAGWRCIGETKGFAKGKAGYQLHGNLKKVFVFSPKKGRVAL